MGIRPPRRSRRNLKNRHGDHGGGSHSTTFDAGSVEKYMFCLRYCKVGFTVLPI